MPHIRVPLAGSFFDGRSPGKLFAGASRDELYCKRYQSSDLACGQERRGRTTLQSRKTELRLEADIVVQNTCATLAVRGGGERRSWWQARAVMARPLGACAPIRIET